MSGKIIPIMLLGGALASAAVPAITAAYNAGESTFMDWASVGSATSLTADVVLMAHDALADQVVEGPGPAYDQHMKGVSGEFISFELYRS